MTETSTIARVSATVFFGRDLRREFKVERTIVCGPSWYLFGSCKNHLRVGQQHEIFLDSEKRMVG